MRHAMPRQRKWSAACFEKDIEVKKPKGNMLAWYDLEFFS